MTTRARMLTVCIGVVCVVVGVWGACVFPDTTIGQECRDSTVCEQGRVCLPLDPAHPSGNGACLPMPTVDAPVSCGNADDCERAGFPVDAACVSSKCVCPPINCNTGQAADPASCVCADLPDAGTGDDAGQ